MNERQVGGERWEGRAGYCWRAFFPPWTLIPPTAHLHYFSIPFAIVESCMLLVPS